MEKGVKIPNSVLMKPLVFLFSNEFEGGSYRKFMTEQAHKKENKSKIKQVLTETLEFYKKINPQGLATVNGEKIIRPSYKSQQS